MALAHALPTESVSLALASPNAFASEVASCIAAGNTPDWYKALPTSVQTLLPQAYPPVVTATPTPTASPSSSAYVVKSSSVVETSTIVTPYPTAGMNSTTAKPNMIATGSPSVIVTLSPTSSGTPTTPNSPNFTGAASKLSMGAGFGAAIAIIGLLAF